MSAYTRERLGMEVQALSLARARSRDSATPRVWAVMTEHGHFWLVEDEGIAEMFRALPTRTSAGNPDTCSNAAEAAQRFRELHPEADRAEAPPPASTSSEDGVAFACQACGSWVTRRRRTDTAVQPLCKRCRHAERERLRYQDDPQYRARRLAYSAARYQQARNQTTSGLPNDGDAGP